LPLAWLFTRRLSRPIREFAEAADRIGWDSDAPLLAETGPDELRIASRALNEMQRGIQQQFRDREAMVAAIAHDLRTPLSRIAFRVEGLPAAVRDPVHRDIEQMKAMIKATIEYSRGLDTAKGEDPVDLAALLGRLVAEEQALGAEVVLAGPDKAAIVFGNEIEFARLFQNLIDNGRKFGGAVELQLHVKRGFAEVAVADRGPGIPAERREEMFTPFVRGEPSRNAETGGVGLGLPIARTIARRHGGELELRQRDGGGLVAMVRLPLGSSAKGRA
jgi:signal transduction histidine kinase